MPNAIRIPDLVETMAGYAMSGSRNLYNPALAVDDTVPAYSTGIEATFSGYALLGHVGIEAGKAYTLSMPNTEQSFQNVLMCYDAYDTYLGLSRVVGTFALAAGIIDSGIVDSGGRWQYRFTVTAGSAVARINVGIMWALTHDTEDFDRVRNSIQLESGMAFARFAAYAEEFPSGFRSRGSINLYDPALAVDGVAAQYAGGTYTPYPTQAQLGHFYVLPGRTYTISMPDSEVGFDAILFCYNSIGTYIGISRALEAYAVAPGISCDHNRRTQQGRWQYTFTLASDSTVYYIDMTLFAGYATHTTADFNRIRNSIQIEVGDRFTHFETYGTERSELDAGIIPGELAALPASVASLTSHMAGLQSTGLTVIRNGDYYYLRTPWDATYDLVEKIARRTSSSTWNNQLFQFVSAGLIAVGNSNDVTPMLSYDVTLKDEADDTAPANFNGTYIGASHGAAFVQEITVTGHDKTVVDVGSKWTDGASVDFYLMRIVDANTLWMLSENTGIGFSWTFHNITGATLTHSANATHTGSITIAGSPVVTQLLPAVRDQVVTFLLDGATEIWQSGSYTCGFLQVICTYNILSVPSVLAYVISCVGGATQPAFDHATITVIARVQVIYEFNDNGSCTVYQSFIPAADIDIGYLGFIQAGAVTIPASGTLHEYVPGVDSFVVDGHTYDLAAIQNVTTLLDSLVLDETTWTAANAPPSRFIQFAKTAGGAVNQNYGFALGYCPALGAGVPATRVNLAGGAAYNLHTTRKQYPRLLSVSSDIYPTDVLPANTLIDAVSFRCAINLNWDTDATSIAWYYVGSDIYLMLDYHAAKNGWVHLPAAMEGRTITVVEKTATFTLCSSFVTPDGIYTVTSGVYDYAVLRLEAG